jgi:hypothetical protein
MQLKSHPIEKTAEQIRQSIKRLEVYLEIHNKANPEENKFIDNLIKYLDHALAVIPEEYRK